MKARERTNGKMSRFHTNASSNRNRTTKQAIDVACILASSSGWWTTYDAHLAYNSRIAKATERTTLRYLHVLADRGIVETKEEGEPSRRKYLWRFVGWPPPIF